jgi:hypothetical protein
MTDETKTPGLTVGQLRLALAGLDADMSVVVRARDEDDNDICGGILVAEVEHAHDEDDTPFFAIDVSSVDEDFEG